MLKFRLAAVALALSLAACSSNDSDDTRLADEQPATPPAIESEADTPPLSDGPLKASGIMQVLSEKTFAYTRGARSGTITYFADGTFTYNEASQGEGSGVWQASDGELCEAFNPTSFLPKGTRSECHPFAATGGGYTAGQTRLTPA